MRETDFVPSPIRKLLGRWSLEGIAYHLFFVVFPLVLLRRALFAGEALFWGTPLLQFVPWQRMAAAMWRGGHLPLWNPLVGCGAPLAANYQSGAFYPLNGLHLLLPAEVALSWTVTLHIALTGWGMYRWGRAVGLDRFPAFIGALALEGSGFLVGRAALFPSIALTFPWLPIWLWRAEVLAQSRRLRDVLWLGLALGLGLLAGHAQTVFYGGTLLAAYLAIRVCQRAGSKKQEGGDTRRAIRNTQYAARFTFRVSRLLLLALIIALGLAAVQLLPTAELLMRSQRASGVSYDTALTYSLWPWRLITFAAPDFFGNPGHGDYWGYANYWEDAGYLGVLPLLLAVGAVTGVVRRRWGSRGAEERRMVFFWLCAAVCGLVLALGKNTPVFLFLYRHVPTFDWFRAPTRWLVVTTVALAALAALGAQRWPRGHRERRYGMLAAVVGGALLIGGLTAPRLVPEMPSTFGPATCRLGVTLAMVGGLTLLREDAVWWRLAVGAFVAADLLLFGWPLVPTVDRALYRGRTETSSLLRAAGDSPRVYWPTDPANPRSEYSAEYRVKFDYLSFDDFGPRDVTHWQGVREALLPNTAMLDGLASINNFDPLLVGRYVDLLEAAVEAPRLLQLMGTSHVITDRAWPGGVRVSKAGSQAVDLYRLPQAHDRVWVVPQARYVPADEMLAVLTDPAFDPTAEVLLEHPASSIKHPASSIQHQASSIQHPASSTQHQVALQEAPNRVTIRAALSEPGYLVLSDIWYPGWHARVDGEQVRVLRANYAFRAVRLEAGEHVVKMVYRPASVLVGGTVSLASLVLLVGGLLLARRKKAEG